MTALPQDHLSHNRIDASAMARFIGAPVARRDFQVEEDYRRELAPGVEWRRRRFRFFVEAPDCDGGLRLEGLCINEVGVDAYAAADLRPEFACEYPHLVDFREVEHAYWATCFASGALRASGSREKQSRMFLNLSPQYFGDHDEVDRELLRKLLSPRTRSYTPEQLLLWLDPMEKEWRPAAGAPGFDFARWLPAFPVSRLVQSSESILAGVNAGYFLNFPEEYEDGISALHQPLGGHFADGHLYMPPWLERPGILAFQDGTREARLFGPEDLVLEVEGLPPVPLRRGADHGDPHGMAWRAHDRGPHTPPPDAAQLVFAGRMLLAAEPAQPHARPPLGGAIVWVTGAHAAAVMKANSWSRIGLKLRSFPAEPDWMLSAGPFLVRENAALPPAAMLSSEHAGEFRPSGPAPTRFPYDADRTRAPRTALGALAGGGWKLVVADGRRGGTHSLGLTLQGLAEVMRWIGCETAVNLDGGGSSVLAIEGAGRADALQESLPYGVVNIPSDDGGRERIVPAMVTVRSRA